MSMRSAVVGFPGIRVRASGPWFTHAGRQARNIAYLYTPALREIAWHTTLSLLITMLLIPTLNTKPKGIPLSPY